MKKVYIKRTDLFENINMVLCNNITDVDDSLIEDNRHMFYQPCDTCNGAGNISIDEVENLTCQECMGESDHEIEPYQYYLCNLSKYKKDHLESFGVVVGYSEYLGVDIIPIYDFGTSWSLFSYSKEVDDDYELGFNETLERKTHY